MSAVPTFKPKPNDVLCGRGRRASMAPGNTRMHSIITPMKPVYAAARKSIKSQMIQKMIGMVRTVPNGPQARFLKQAEGFPIGVFREATYKEVHDKISHCLRETPSEARRELRMRERNKKTKKRSARPIMVSIAPAISPSTMAAPPQTTGSARMSRVGESSASFGLKMLQQHGIPFEDDRCVSESDDEGFEDDSSTSGDNQVVGV